MMRELVGVIHLTEVYDTASIKQEALLFDRIAVLDFHRGYAVEEPCDKKAE